MKPCLGEMPVVGQHLGEPLAAHHVHRHAISEAVFLIRTGLIERQTGKKEFTGLGDDRHRWRGEQTADSRRRSLAQQRSPGAVGRQILVEDRIRGIEVMRGERRGERGHTLVPLVRSVQERDPIMTG